MKTMIARRPGFLQCDGRDHRADPAGCGSSSATVRCSPIGAFASTAHLRMVSTQVACGVHAASDAVVVAADFLEENPWASASATGPAAVGSTTRHEGE